MDKDWGSFFDALMDRLPASTRKKVLDQVEIDDEGNVERTVQYSTEVRVPVKHRGLYIVLSILVFVLWSTPLTVAGLIICLTIIGIPIGAFLILLGCYPLAFLFGKVAGA